MMLGFNWRTPWRLPTGWWRLWVCSDCRVVTYHHLSYCPTCGRKLVYVRDRSSNLEKQFPTRPGSDYRPYEFDPRFTDEQQPWRVHGFQRAEPVRESREQMEHDAHMVAAHESEFEILPQSCTG